MITNTNSHLNDCVQLNNAAFSLLFDTPHIVGPRPEAPPAKQLVVERVDICCEINCIADLLQLIDHNPVVENVEYNVNMRALHRISEPLRKLDAMVGMDSLKENVVDQIIYFIQDLHKNEKTNGDKGDKENKENKENKGDKSSGVFNDYTHTIGYNYKTNYWCELYNILGIIWCNI
jgi:hypothetical protein